MSFDLDDVLDLEKNFHEEGHQLGLQQDTSKEFIDSKEYGYQISFQRFLLIGYYKSVLQYWLKVISSQDGSSNRLKAVEKTVLELLESIDALSYENNEANGILYDQLTARLKLKMRLVNLSMSKFCGDKLKEMQNDVVAVGGVLEIQNAGDSNDLDNGIW